MREIPQIGSACGIHGGVRHAKQVSHKNIGKSSTKRGNNRLSGLSGRKVTRKLQRKYALGSGNPV